MVCFKSNASFFFAKTQGFKIEFKLFDKKKLIESKNRIIGSFYRKIKTYLYLYVIVVSYF